MTQQHETFGNKADSMKSLKGIAGGVINHSDKQRQ